jgi:hypothetical protein
LGFLKLSKSGIPLKGRLPILLLVAANAVPLFGALFLDWDVFRILLLFWFENVIIGFFGIARVVVAGRSENGAGGLGKALFFVIHYGGFMFGHLMLLFGMFSPGAEGNGQLESPAELLAQLKSNWLWVSVIALFVSHAWSFAENFLGRSEYEKLSSGDAMALPYRRMMITHIALLIGGLLLERTGQPLFGLVLLILLKIGLDVTFHKREHERLAR